MSRTENRSSGLRHQAPPAPARPRRIRVDALIFGLPTILVFALFSWWPLLRGLALSFQHTNFLQTTWVGLENFNRVLSDPLLGQAVTNTAYFALLAALFGFPVPLLAATLIAEMRHSRQLATVLVFIPVILPPVVGILLWREFYDPGKDGLFNSLLGVAGIGPVAWLQDSITAMPSLVLMATWSAFGQGTVIFVAALMSIRSELYEAAEIDGASLLRRFWHITLPQLRTVVLVLLLLQIIGTLQVFTEPFLLTGGGPENKTMTVLLLIYNYAFVYGDFGAATALSLLLAVVLAAVSAGYLFATRKWSRT
ncbi:multiple sugar transport system permease protein [Kribbella aluminosa]|uniref:Multiple sugar transport system permease protein n=1 Tax=Kribbella aluminosa TaxID=416017 RepID=A0ABS4UJ92_9ACTN|nr:sugar ABC transporter permease [Kribbella aluminosa]MBP2351626.1 multiple sugar transport system permease protein [Kribbella aluminosa]